MALKDYSDNEAVRSRGQEMVSTSEIFIFIFNFFFRLFEKKLDFFVQIFMLRLVLEKIS